MPSFKHDLQSKAHRKIISHDFQYLQFQELPAGGSDSLCTLKPILNLFKTKEDPICLKKYTYYLDNITKHRFLIFATKY